MQFTEEFEDQHGRIYLLGGNITYLVASIVVKIPQVDQSQLQSSDKEPGSSKKFAANHHLRLITRD